MATVTKLPIAFAETMASVLETSNVEALAPQEVSTHIGMCVYLQGLFAIARQSITERVSQGMDARTFAAEYEPALAGLEAILTTTQRIMTKAQTSVLPQPAEQVIASYRALMDDVMSLREFLANVVAKAKMPARPFDWKRAQEAEAAFARGETKPFERSAKR